MTARILGDFATQNSGMSLDYFEGRDCWLDCRAPGMITIHEQAMFGWEVKIVVQSHDPLELGRVVDRPVTIDAGAWIGSFAILYNCYVGMGAIVAVGSVVRSRDVPPNTMVEGNPARIIAVREGDKWNYLPNPIDLPMRKVKP